VGYWCKDWQPVVEIWFCFRIRILHLASISKFVTAQK